MSLRLSQRKIDQLTYAARKAEADRAEAVAEAAAADAVCVVAQWNARARDGAPPPFFPTFGAAGSARMTRLAFMCPGCQQIGETDLRRLDFHPDAPISALIPRLSCRRCSPNPPLAVLLELLPS